MGQSGLPGKAPGTGSGADTPDPTHLGQNVRLSDGIRVENGRVIWQLDSVDARELSYVLDQRQGWGADARRLFEAADEAEAANA